MFYCDICRKKKNLPWTGHRSYGRCEICGRQAVCHNDSD